MIEEYSVNIEIKEVHYSEFKKKYSDYKHYDYNAEKKTITVEVPVVDEIKVHLLHEFEELKKQYCERWADRFPTRLERYLDKIDKACDKLANMSEEELLNIYLYRKHFELTSLFD